MLFGGWAGQLSKGVALFFMILSWHQTDEENYKKVFVIIPASELFMFLHGRVICF
jgi:hypothetical protein